MIPAETLTVFIAASVVLALSPGPDNIFVLMQSALYGRMAGVLVTLGLCTGVLVHTAAVAFGVAAIVATSAAAFTALKILGASYLLYLAWGAWRAGPTALNDDGTGRLPGSRLYLRGIVMNATNPKVAIFFLAFLPQFVDPARGSIPQQVLLLGAVFMLVALVMFCSFALAAGYLGDWLRRSSRAQIALNRFAAVVFVALALRLVTAER